jgi:hypothetical protein
MPGTPDEKKTGMSTPVAGGAEPGAQPGLPPLTPGAGTCGAPPTEPWRAGKSRGASRGANGTPADVLESSLKTPRPLVPAANAKVKPVGTKHEGPRKGPTNGSSPGWERNKAAPAKPAYLQSLCAPRFQHQGLVKTRQRKRSLHLRFDRGSGCLRQPV